MNIFHLEIIQINQYVINNFFHEAILFEIAIIKSFDEFIRCSTDWKSLVS